jgi:subtilisin family serine protease
MWTRTFAIVLALCWASTLSSHAYAQKTSMAALESVQRTGSVRVLVMLAEPRVSGLKSGQVREAGIRSAVDGVLARLPSSGRRIHHRFKLVPAIAMTIDEASLQRLRHDSAVIRIDVDAGGSGGAAPDAASDLNHVSALQALGLNGAGMKVAVIDTGVDTDHVDLRTRLVGQQCFCSNLAGTGGCCPNGQAIQSGNGAAEDDHGHGTNVTGIIVGEGNVAPRGAVPAAELVAVKVLDSLKRFCCTSDIVAALDWLAANHPDVDAVNMSLGTDSVFAGDCDNASAFTQAMAVAVGNLVQLGAVVTASSGNQGDSSRTQLPACVASVVGVAATWDFNGGAMTHLGCTDASTAPRQPTCFSNRSVTTDLYAAGAFVTSTGRTGGTSTMAGTSMAAPMVAACAVALKQVAPLATVGQRIDAMKLSPTWITDTVSGRRYPFLDCTDAVGLLTPAPAPIRVNGSQPLIPPGSQPSTAAASPIVVPASEQPRRNRIPHSTRSGKARYK